MLTIFCDLMVEYFIICTSFNTSFLIENNNLFVLLQINSKYELNIKVHILIILSFLIN